MMPCPQFENHIRAVLGWPLGDTSLTSGSAVMLNLLGEAEGEAGVSVSPLLGGGGSELLGCGVGQQGKHQSPLSTFQFTLHTPDSYR